MKKLLKYDFFYLRKTSKFIVFGAILFIFSAISPLTAKYINQILEFVLAGEGINLGLPEPTILTAYEQYISDLYEIIFTVILFVAIAVFIRDKTKGLQPLIFSKPINRTKYLLSKYISFFVLVVISLTIGYLTFSYYTYFLFDDVFFGKGILMMLLYLVDIAFITSVALFAATYLKSYIGGILATYGIYILFSILAVFDTAPILEFFPGIIKINMVQYLYDIHEVSHIIWNVVVTTLIIAGFIGLSIKRIRNQDI